MLKSIMGLMLGLLLGYFVPVTIPVAYSKLFSVILLAMIDAVFGGLRASLEKTFDDVRKQGEIEGLTFDENRGQLLLLYK